MGKYKRKVSNSKACIGIAHVACARGTMRRRGARCPRGGRPTHTQGPRTTAGVSGDTELPTTSRTAPSLGSNHISNRQGATTQHPRFLRLITMPTATTVASRLYLVSRYRLPAISPQGGFTASHAMHIFPSMSTAPRTVVLTPLA